MTTPTEWNIEAVYEYAIDESARRATQVVTERRLWKTAGEDDEVRLVIEATSTGRAALTVEVREGIPSEVRQIVLEARSVASARRAGDAIAAAVALLPSDEL